MTEYTTNSNDQTTALDVVYKDTVDLKQASFDEEELDDEEKSLTGDIKPWDEGGASDCGYSDVVHTTLMGIGSSIHALVGEPSSTTKHVQKIIGNWFQELSYAARDIVRGEGSDDMKKDASDAVNELIQGGHDVLQATGSTISEGLSKTIPGVGTVSA